MSVAALVGIGRTPLQLGRDSFGLEHMAAHRRVLAHRRRKADVDHHQPTDVLGSGIEQETSLGKCHGDREVSPHMLTQERPHIGAQTRWDIHRDDGPAGGIHRGDDLLEHATHFCLETSSQQCVDQDIVIRQPRSNRLGRLQTSCTASGATPTRCNISRCAPASPWIPPGLAHDEDTGPTPPSCGGSGR